MNPTIYISPSQPNWQPKTENDIQAAISDGLIGETHFMEVKREITPVSVKKDANKELARDLASFAVDGGTVIVGIDEDKKTGVFSLAPQPLQGVDLRIESVARSLIDQPLEIIITAIPNAADNTKGYLFIHIPISPVAPHMVENRYIGRSDKSKSYLSDAEVVRLHERRAAQQPDGIGLLREFMQQRDPVPDHRRKNAHLFLLAQPVQKREDMLLKLTGDVNAQSFLSSFRKAAYGKEITDVVDIRSAVPGLTDAYIHEKRPEGAALVSGTTITDDDCIITFDVQEDGGLRIMSTRLSDGKDVRHDNLIFDEAAVVLVRQLIVLAKRAAEISGYTGGWIFAVGANGLRGKYTAALQNYGYEATQKHKYDADEYIQPFTATYAQIRKSPGLITGKLLGRFLRSIGSDRENVHAMTDQNDDEQVAL